MAKQLLAKGLGASPGTATGAVALRSEDALALASRGQAVIFVRMDATPEDVPGMKAAAGIVTTRGGITGDAAIVARSLGKPCVTSCPSLRVDYEAKTLTAWSDTGADEDDVVVREGELISIDGATGEIWKG